MKFCLVLLCLLYFTTSLTFKKEWHEYNYSGANTKSHKKISVTSYHHPTLSSCQCGCKCFSILSSGSYHLGPFVSVSSNFCRQDTSYLHRKGLYIANETCSMARRIFEEVLSQVYIWNKRMSCTGLSDISVCSWTPYDIM